MKNNNTNFKSFGTINQDQMIITDKVIADNFDLPNSEIYTERTVPITLYFINKENEFTPDEFNEIAKWDNQVPIISSVSTTAKVQYDIKEELQKITIEDIKTTSIEEEFFVVIEFETPISETETFMLMIPSTRCSNSEYKIVFVPKLVSTTFSKPISPSFKTLFKYPLIRGLDRNNENVINYETQTITSTIAADADVFVERNCVLSTDFQTLKDAGYNQIQLTIIDCNAGYFGIYQPDIEPDTGAFWPNGLENIKGSTFYNSKDIDVNINLETGKITYVVNGNILSTIDFQKTDLDLSNLSSYRIGSIGMWNGSDAGPIPLNVVEQYRPAETRSPSFKELFEDGLNNQAAIDFTNNSIVGAKDSTNTTISSVNRTLSKTFQELIDLGFEQIEASIDSNIAGAIYLGLDNDETQINLIDNYTLVIEDRIIYNADNPKLIDIKINLINGEVQILGGNGSFDGTTIPNLDMAKLANYRMGSIGLSWTGTGTQYWYVHASNSNLISPSFKTLFENGFTRDLVNPINYETNEIYAKRMMHTADFTTRGCAMSKTFQELIDLDYEAIVLNLNTKSFGLVYIGDPELNPTTSTYLDTWRDRGFYGSENVDLTINLLTGKIDYIINGYLDNRSEFPKPDLDLNNFDKLRVGLIDTQASAGYATITTKENIKEYTPIVSTELNTDLPILGIALELDNSGSNGLFLNKTYMYYKNKLNRDLLQKLPYTMPKSIHQSPYAIWNGSALIEPSLMDKPRVLPDSSLVLFKWINMNLKVNGLEEYNQYVFKTDVTTRENIGNYKVLNDQKVMIPELLLGLLFDKRFAVLNKHILGRYQEDYPIDLVISEEIDILVDSPISIGNNLTGVNFEGNHIDVSELVEVFDKKVDFNNNLFIPISKRTPRVDCNFTSITNAEYHLRDTEDLPDEENPLIVKNLLDSSKPLIRGDFELIIGFKITNSGRVFSNGILNVDVDLSGINIDLNGTEYNILGNFIGAKTLLNIGILNEELFYTVNGATKVNTPITVSIDSGLFTIGKADAIENILNLYSLFISCQSIGIETNWDMTISNGEIYDVNEVAPLKVWDSVRTYTKIRGQKTAKYNLIPTETISKTSGVESTTTGYPGFKPYFGYHFGSDVSTLSPITGTQYSLNGTSNKWYEYNLNVKFTPLEKINGNITAFKLGGISIYYNPYTNYLQVNTPSSYNWRFYPSGGNKTNEEITVNVVSTRARHSVIYSYTYIPTHYEKVYRRYSNGSIIYYNGKATYDMVRISAYNRPNYRTEDWAGHVVQTITVSYSGGGTQSTSGTYTVSNTNSSHTPVITGRDFVLNNLTFSGNSVTPHITIQPNRTSLKTDTELLITNTSLTGDAYRFKNTSGYIDDSLVKEVLVGDYDHANIIKSISFASYQNGPLKCWYNSEIGLGEIELSEELNTLNMKVVNLTQAIFYDGNKPRWLIIRDTKNTASMEQANYFAPAATYNSIIAYPLFELKGPIRFRAEKMYIYNNRFFTNTIVTKNDKTYQISTPPFPNISRYASPLDYSTANMSEVGDFGTNVSKDAYNDFFNTAYGQLPYSVVKFSDNPTDTDRLVYGDLDKVTGFGNFQFKIKPSNRI